MQECKHLLAYKTYKKCICVCVCKYIANRKIRKNTISCKRKLFHFIPHYVINISPLVTVMRTTITQVNARKYVCEWLHHFQFAALTFILLIRKVRRRLCMDWFEAVSVSESIYVRKYFICESANYKYTRTRTHACACMLQFCVIRHSPLPFGHRANFRRWFYVLFAQSCVLRATCPTCCSL